MFRFAFSDFKCLLTMIKKEASSKIVIVSTRCHYNIQILSVLCSGTRRATSRVRQCYGSTCTGNINRGSEKHHRPRPLTRVPWPPPLHPRSARIYNVLLPASLYLHPPPESAGGASSQNNPSLHGTETYFLQIRPIGAFVCVRHIFSPGNSNATRECDKKWVSRETWIY